MNASDPPAHPSKDPRASLVIFAELLARLSDPFCDRALELEALGLSESALEDLERAWTAKILPNPSAAAIFEQAFVACIERRSSTFAEERTEAADSGASRETVALAEVQARLGTVVDPNETLPVTAASAAALPFRSGDFRPLPALRRAREQRRSDEDPDATRLPVSIGNETLPFVKRPDKS